MIEWKTINSLIIFYKTPTLKLSLAIVSFVLNFIREIFINCNKCPSPREPNKSLAELLARPLHRRLKIFGLKFCVFFPGRCLYYIFSRTNTKYFSSSSAYVKNSRLHIRSRLNPHYRTPFSAHKFCIGILQFLVGIIFVRILCFPEKKTSLFLMLAHLRFVLIFFFFRFLRGLHRDERRRWLICV